MGHAITSVAGRLARRLRRETAAFERRLAGARAGDVEAVHQARVASRRLREMLALAATVAGADVRPVRRVARHVARALGPIRELDVARLVWHEDAGPAERWPAIVTRRLDTVAAADRRRYGPGMRRTVDRVRPAKLDSGVAAIVAALAGPRAESHLRAGLAGRVRRRARDLARAIETAGTVYAIEPLHDVRIAVKKLRYAVELVRDLTDLPVTASVRRLKQQQDLLGRLHDLQVVQDRLQAAAASAGVSRTMRRALEGSQASVELECRSLHARFVRGVPRLADLCQALRAQVAIRLVQPRVRQIRATPPAALSLLAVGAGRES
jgi:CHAD domain-containing protein